MKPGLSRPVGPIVRPQVCISNTKTPKSVVQILRPQVRRTNTETSGQHFNYWDLRSAIQILSSYQCGGSVPTENIWIISEKWKWNFGNLHLPQLAAGSESERKYLLLLRWKVQKCVNSLYNGKYKLEGKLKSVTSQKNFPLSFNNIWFYFKVPTHDISLKKSNLKLKNWESFCVLT